MLALMGSKFSDWLKGSTQFADAAKPNAPPETEPGLFSYTAAPGQTELVLRLNGNVLELGTQTGEGEFVVLSSGACKPPQPWLRIPRRRVGAWMLFLGMFLVRMLAGVLARRERQRRNETDHEQP